MDKMKLMMDEVWLHSESRIPSEPDFLHTEFCPKQIVKLSSGRSAAMRSQRNL